MTEQIKYKIGEQEVSVEYDEYGSTRITRELLEDLIKGRCMWEEILQELEETRKNVTELNIEYYLGELAGLKTAIDIINQKLSNIEE